MASKRRNDNRSSMLMTRLIQLRIKETVYCNIKAKTQTVMQSMYAQKVLYTNSMENIRQTIIGGVIKSTWRVSTHIVESIIQPLD